MHLPEILFCILACAYIVEKFDPLTLAAEHDTPPPPLACLDEQGAPIDWFIGYKFPQIKEDARFDTGYSYAYITNKNVAKQVEHSESATEFSANFAERLPFYLSRFEDLLMRYTGMSTKALLKHWHINNQFKGAATKRKSSRGEQDNNGTRWLLSNLKITHEDSALMRTLRAAYETEQIDAILYNDEPSDTFYERKNKGKNSSSTDYDQSTVSLATSKGARKRRETSIKSDSSKAHAKGVLMLDLEANRGVWLTHSVPRFPPKLDEPLHYPESAHHFGQTFMCITFDLNKVGSMVVDHLRTMQPQVYDHRVSAAMYERLPHLRDLDDWTRSALRGRRRAIVAPKLAQTITTNEGQVLKLFAKSRQFHSDLYAGWIDRELSSALYVETWRRGAGTPLNSSCPANEYHVNNVNDLNYDAKAKWSYLNDHSKWAISDEEQLALVCLGDSNRMESQFSRGGGAVCLKCLACWKIFSNTILDVEPCPRDARDGRRKLTKLEQPD